MKRLLSLLLLALTLSLGLADTASAHGPHGRVWGGVSIGIGAPFYGGGYGVPYYGYGGYGGYYRNYGYGYGYAPYAGVYAPGVYAPGVVVMAPPLTYSTYAAPVPSTSTSTSLPEPIFYPRKGQSPAQIEADRQACNHWAGTQPNANTDASVFQRGTLACMDAHGYTSR